MSRIVETGPRATPWLVGAAVVVVAVVWVVRACDRAVDAVTGPDVRAPTLSQRSELRAFGPLVFRALHAESEIYVARGDGSRPRALLVGGSPAWSPDGRRIVFERGGDIWVAGRSGRRARRLVEWGDDPAWSPDGRSIAFERGDTILVLRVGDRRPRVLARRGADPAWSPDGGRIAFVSTRDGLESEPGIFGATPIHQVYVMDADGSDERRLSETGTDDASPAWSPDGERIAFSTRSDEWVTTETGLVVVDADGGDVERRFVRAFDAEPSWSPDGRWLVLVCDVVGSVLCAARADGDGDLVALSTGDRRNMQAPSWRPARR